MHTCTFYSFKGGVGRTMALVNTALELSRRGTSVVLIDFDLEAPGLTTFDRLRPDGPIQGVVEFVSEYIRTGVAPDVRDFVYKAAKSTDTAGDIFVMPAGREDEDYRQALARIDWVDLYANKDGFVFFEDMKLQLKAFANPDYLLIDSRTGHSDVEGICTRHLPDSIVVLFFPNEQNLIGLEGVCRSIRNEKDSGLQKDILIHFAMSNVPDLDDEDEILRARIKSFRSRLRFERLATRIHHYNSLSLLNQSIFVQDRPRSRLAKEYRKLVEELIKSNPSDRAGALLYLNEIVSGDRSALDLNKLTRIDENFNIDPEVQLTLAKVIYSEGRFSDALPHVNRALDTDDSKWEAYFYRASIFNRLNEDTKAAQDLMSCLHSSDIDAIHTLRSFRNLTITDPSLIAQALETPAIRNLDWHPKFEVANDLTRDKDNWRLSIPILTDIWENGNTRGTFRSAVKHHLSLVLIRAGLWDDAIQLLSGSDSMRNLSETSEIVDKFNLAMADWGKTKVPSSDLFNGVLNSLTAIHDLSNANHYQCLAISYWATGQTDKAIDHLERAIELAAISPSEHFSCWRYASAKPMEFLADCEAIRKLIIGENIEPMFIHLTRNR